jgi:hypothetical protein
MITIDRQRIAAVKALEAMGYRFRDDKWLAPDATAGSPKADAMHALLVRCADQLEGRIEGSAENLVSRGVGLMRRPRVEKASSLLHSRGRSPGEAKRPPHHGGERRE